jgi:hypothetical protein
MSKEIVIVNSNELKWEDDPRSYMKGVKRKVLWKDKKTGARIELSKWSTDSWSETHAHLKSNEAIFFLAGEAEDHGGNRFSVEGVLSFMPKGVAHGSSSYNARAITKEVISLHIYDGSSE